MHEFFTDENKLRPGNLPSDSAEEILCDYGAARFLISQNNLMKFKNGILYKDVLIKNYAAILFLLSEKLNVPRYHLATRLFDILSNFIENDLVAIIEWCCKKDTINVYEHLNISPKWSVCSDSYIPWIGSNKQCHLKNNSTIHQVIKNKNFLYFEESIEDVSIGTLIGKYYLFVCAFGKQNSKDRRVISIFKKIS